MGDKLKGRNAVVTGAGRGIGRAIAIGLAEEGANVVVCDIGGMVDGSGGDKTPADQVVDECKKHGVKAIAQYGDVSKFADAEAAVKACVSNFGRIDILCNIAGIDKPKMIWNMTEQEWDQVVAVHLKGTFNFMRNAAQYMVEQNYGRIINTTSEAWMGGLSHLNYGAAKGGITTLTWGGAQELGPRGITVNAICPRAKTRMTDKPEVRAMVEKRVAKGLMDASVLKRMDREMVDPSAFAKIVAFLASDDAALINGQVFLTTAITIARYSKPEEVTKAENPSEGPWTMDMVKAAFAPDKLLKGYVNPAPPAPPAPPKPEVKK
jgi:NAD(P)-dependent dehydrogenase (short-subunit alcohol dehydrogenase family)